MKKGKYSTPRHSLRGTGVLALMLALALAVGGITGGTIAWLTAKTDKISNTFVVGNIGLELTESAVTTASKDKDNIVVPGQTFTKDTKVTVKANSVKCYLFLHVDEQNNPTVGDGGEKRIIWNLSEDGWSEVSGHSGYYCRAVNHSTQDQYFSLISENKLTVNPEITKENVETIKANPPSLTFTAAAVQADNIPDANSNNKIGWMDAWELLPTAFTNPTTPLMYAGTPVT